MKEIKLEKHPIADIKDHTKLYAFICPERGEGIITFGDSIETQKPLVFMSIEVAEKFFPFVEDMAAVSSRKIELREYTLSKVLKSLTK